MIEKRSIAKAVIFSLVTCGIYGLYWFYKLTEESHALLGRRTTASGGMAILFTLISCGIYGIYWLYKIAETVNEAKQNRGMKIESSAPIIYLLLALFGLAIIGEALIQDGLNDIIEHDQNGGNGYAMNPMDSGNLNAPQPGQQPMPWNNDPNDGGNASQGVSLRKPEN